jgi:integrase
MNGNMVAPSMTMGTHIGKGAIARDAPTEKAVRDHLLHMNLQGRSALTAYHRERALIRLAGSIPLPLLQATPSDLYQWRASLAVGAGTAAGYISHVREFYKWAVTKGLLAEDPAAALPVPATARRVPRPIPSADLHHALSMASAKVRPMLVLAAWCGMRACEIAGLRAENVRLRDERPIILIAAEATKGRRERAIPLSAFVIAEMVIAGLPPPRGPVFPSADGRHLRPWMISKICNEHLHRCGIPSTLHTLRHWCATTAYAVDNDLIGVQELLGHAVIQTTAGYAALNRSRTAALVNAMPGADQLTRQAAS